MSINYILKNLLYVHLREAAKQTPYFTIEELHLIGTECLHTAINNQFIRSSEEEDHSIQYTSKLVILFYYSQVLPIEENFINTFNL
jgi:hypothetical protein